MLPPPGGDSESGLGDRVHDGSAAEFIPPRPVAEARNLVWKPF